MCSTFGLKNTDIVVSHGGAMVMHGLRPHTDDIDVSVNSDDWNHFIDRGFEVKVLPPCGDLDEVKLIAVTDEMDVHLYNESPRTLVEIEGVMCTDLAQTLRDKLALNREKDKKDILALEIALGLH